MPTSPRAVVIPAYKPPAGFPATVRELVERGFRAVIVVDDGSDASFRPVFEAAAAVDGCTVLRHGVNCGQGRALKTGFHHVLTQRADGAGVVTFDCDGQHLPEDAARVAAAMERDPAALILGTRSFAQGVPWKSLVGNLLTRWLFTFMLGRRIADTQSGLRGLPRAALPELARLSGEGFEYNMNMLVRAHALGLRIVEEPIRTVYIEGNRSTHFQPVRDSMRVTFVLVRFYLSSLVAAATDFTVFVVLYQSTSRLFLSMMVARAVAGALVNFAINRAFVFQSRTGVAGALLKFYLLLTFSGLVSYAGVYALSQTFGWPVLVCKVLVEVPLSLFNFAIQRMFVFRPSGS